MIRLLPRSSRTDTRVPYPTRCRSLQRSTWMFVFPAASMKSYAFTEWKNMKLGIWYVAMLFRGIVLVRGRLLVAGYEEVRSEEHTSELQSLMRISYAVFCMKKKTAANTTTQPKNDL